jgi:hypothetical protein
VTKRRQRVRVDAAQLAKAIDHLADLAERDELDLALAGGYAMQVYGSDRFTQDIDVLSDETLGWPVEGPLTFGGDRTYAPNGVPVDVIRRDDEYLDLYDEALDRSVEVEGVPIPVVAPEYLVAMKMQAGRKKDELDLHFLIGEEVADLVKARTIVKKFLGRYAAESLDRIVEEVAWLKTRKQ